MMTRYPLEYLERVLQVDVTREAIAKAHRARMAIEDRKGREQAKLSDFLTIEEYTKAWFINDEAKIPVCRGWPREELAKPTHHVERRTCILPTMCTAWEPIPQVKSCTAGALTDYLRALRGREPTLNPVASGQRIVVDEEGIQYRFVTMPNLRIPSPIELQSLFKTMEVTA